MVEKKNYRLTKDQLEMLRDVYNGADIYALHMASFLRRLESDRTGLVSITAPYMAPSSGAMQQPYFGCILTKSGRLVVDVLTDHPEGRVGSRGRYYSLEKEANHA